jgi:bacterioferritin
MIIDRIFFLEGKVEIAALTSNVASTLSEIFAMDLELEMRNHSDLSKAIVDCEQNQDFGTREIFKEILIETEEHIDWLETQIELIERVGLEIYQQAQMFA